MLQSGALLAGRYVVDAVIGQGGMGHVYRAHTREGEAVAIKELAIAFEDELQQHKMVQQFTAEGALLSRLSHPHLPRVHECFESDKRYYLVMELISGGTLYHRVEKGGTASESQAIAWGLQLCDVLEYLHGQAPPIVFRDLKPSNCMLSALGDIKLIDFGIAKIFEKALNARTQTIIRGVGSKGFAPIEQYRGGTDPRTDIYALGATLYFVLTARVPVEPVELVVGRPAVPLESYRSDVSPDLCGAIAGMLALMPDHRPQNVQTVRAALQKCRRDAAPSASSPSQATDRLPEANARTAHWSDPAGDETQRLEP